MKDVWKKVLVVNSVLWCIAAVYFVYAATYGVLSLDWNRFLIAILVIAFFTATQVLIAILGD